MSRTFVPAFLSLIFLAACEGPQGALIRELPADETRHVSALQQEAHVVRTEGDVPHVYAATRHDAAWVLGFTTARDRYFMMDLARRLATGRITELLGDAGLESDQQSRLTGITYLTDQITARVTPSMGEYMDAYSEGVNAYIEEVRAGKLPAPSELELAGIFIGAATPADAMAPFARRDLAAIVALTVYESSFETGDIERARVTQSFDTRYAGARDEALRKAGLVGDIWNQGGPLFPIKSAPGLGTTYGEGMTQASTQSAQRRLPPRGAQAPGSLLARVSTALTRMQIRFNRDRVSGYGSNAWAVAGSATANGEAVVAGDGHLALSIPPVLFQFGVDTATLGDGDLHQLGLTIPGFPLMAIGTNGKVAWSQTQLGEDVTDWYRELVQLDANGVPSATRWGDEWKPVTRVEETFVVKDVPALGSTGRIETMARFLTFDGRWIADYEGRKIGGGDPLEPGQSRQLGVSGYVVPSDEDGDGTITALSFSYTGLSAAELLVSVDALGHAEDVEGFRQATRGLVGYSQNFAVSDSKGSILYTSYQSLPCRKDLPRNPDGSFAAGADPSLLLDGTRYGAWRIPIKDGLVDESLGADSATCVVPFDKVPQSVNPTQGYIVTANNDPGGLSFDGSVWNEEVYLGGPWDEGIRADTISRALQKQIAEKRVDVASMAELQRNVDSRLGELFTPHILSAIAHGKAGGADAASLRLAALYRADSAGFDEVAGRLDGWRTRGYQARSGVRTFYATPDAVAVADAVPTMIFNAWMRRAILRVFGDEGIDDVIASAGEESRVRIMARLFQGRGDAPTPQLASFDPTRKESVFFDDLTTPDVVESSDEEILLALADALASLRAQPDDTWQGGFGTGDMSKWLWGLQHQVRFESLIADYLTDPALSFITSQLEINTSVLPLLREGDSFGDVDRRASLRWFPRDGDQFSVNAANPGLAGTQYTYGSGPVMRMVFELSSRGVRGQNIIPGGQSGITSSPHYADQAKRWLADEAYPVHFDAESVVRAATRHEVFTPQ